MANSSLSSEYIEDLPIVLVFSLATTLATVHNALPHSVSTRLHIETFQAEPSLQCLHEILNKVQYFSCDALFKDSSNQNFSSSLIKQFNRL